MKEDILEQLVDDYLKFNGYFTAHNVKFQPSPDAPDYVKKDDCVPSDVDVIGLHPLREGSERVYVVSCKSWQAGFDPNEKIASIERNKVISGRDAWRGFRELVKQKWANALIGRVRELTGSTSFTYITAVTRLKTDARVWSEYPLFRQNLRGNPIRILTLQEMLTDLYGKLNTAVASSQVGRLLQVMKASGWQP